MNSTLTIGNSYEPQFMPCFVLTEGVGRESSMPLRPLCTSVSVHVLYLGLKRVEGGGAQMQRTVVHCPAPYPATKYPGPA